MHQISEEQKSKTLHTLDEFITALSESDQFQYNTIFRSLKLPISVFENYCSWSDKAYTRNCIVENDKFELILLCWSVGQKTPIHNHGGEECWVKVIEGDIKELIYKTDDLGKLSVVKSSISTTNDISYMIDFMGYHSLENLSNKRSMSLHLYAKPIRNCDVFDEDSGKFVNKKMAYHTCSELLAV